MGGGNGAKSHAKREANAKKLAGPSGSQLKVNQASMNIICQVCRQTFMLTTKSPELTQHADNKHKKTQDECFPGFVEQVSKKSAKVAAA